jgi:phospholipid/cholesterol/gamma-HCH transport system ATP-binding protein
LLYDEPTTGLDPVNIARITDLIQHLQRTLDVTSIVVTHDMPSAFRVSNRIAMIQDGTVIFSGTPKALAHADDPRVRDFVEGNAPENEDASVILGGTA